MLRSVYSLLSEILSQELDALSSAGGDLADKLSDLSIQTSPVDQSELNRLSALITQIEEEKSGKSDFTLDRLDDFSAQADALDLGIANTLAEKTTELDTFSANLTAFQNDKVAFEADIADWNARLNQDIFDPDVFNELDDELSALQTRQMALQKRADELAQSLADLITLLDTPLVSTEQSAQITAIQTALNTPPNGFNWLWVLGALGLLGGITILPRWQLRNSQSKRNEAIQQNKQNGEKTMDPKIVNLLNQVSEKDRFSIQHILQNNPYDFELSLSQDVFRVFPRSLSNPTLGIEIPYDNDVDIAELLKNLNPPPTSSDGISIPHDQGYVFGGSAAGTSQLYTGGPHPDVQAATSGIQGQFRNAIGRIGYAYDHEYETLNNRPIYPNMPFSRGTGILLTTKHVMTNRHVYENLVKTNDLIGSGIEFMALHGISGSDFHPFDGNLPHIFDNLDIAIFTLAEDLPTQKPLPIMYLQSKPKIGSDITVIGYPHPHNFPDKQYNRIVNFEKVNIQEEAYGGEDAILSIKRESKGKIFRPKYFPNGEITLDYKYGQTPLFCFNATTSSGNSGSPIFNELDTLIGIFFKHDADFFHESYENKFNRKKDPANLAIPINSILDVILNNWTGPIPSDTPLNETIKHALDMRLQSMINSQNNHVA